MLRPRPYLRQARTGQTSDISGHKRRNPRRSGMVRAVPWAEELSELIRARATTEGRIASAFPGLWFYRADQPPPPKGRVRAKTTHLAVAADGGKRIRAGGLE